MSAIVETCRLPIAMFELRMYALQLKNAFKNSSIQGFGFEEKRNAFIENCNETLAWFDSNTNPQLPDFDGKKAQLVRSFHEVLEVFLHYELISYYSFIRSNE